MKHRFLQNHMTISRMRVVLLESLTAVALAMAFSSCGSGGPGSSAPASGFYIQSVYTSGVTQVRDFSAGGRACRSDTLSFFPEPDFCTPDNHGVQSPRWTEGEFIANSSFPANWS